MLNDIKKLKEQQQQQQEKVLLQKTTTSNIVNNIFFEYYYNTNENFIKIPSPSSSLPSTPLSIQSSKSISTTSSESINVDQLNQQQLEHNQLQQMFINAYTNEEYVCLDDIDILKPIHINCSYFNYNPVVISAPVKQQSTGLLKISKTQLREQHNKRPSSVSTSSPSSCSFSSNSLSSSSLALVSPQDQYKDNFLAATPDTSNSSSATMIIRKSPEIVQSASPIPAQTNLNHIFSQYDRNKVTSSGGS
jgi:hypothetical protein